MTDRVSSYSHHTVLTTETRKPNKNLRENGLRAMSHRPSPFHPIRWKFYEILLNDSRDIRRNITNGPTVHVQWGWSDGAMVLGKLPVLGRPTILITVGQGHIALAVGEGGDGLEFLLSSILSLLSPSLWETARYRLKYCLKGPLNPKQPTNQPTNYMFNAFTISRLPSDLPNHHISTFLLIRHSLTL